MQTPEPGFYYHYKHNPDAEFNNYAYEVVGIGHHTEMKDSDDALMVVYRPLYDSFVYRNGKMFDLRPLVMFMEKVEKPEYKGPRFIKITDPSLISRLAELRDQMYPRG